MNIRALLIEEAREKNTPLYIIEKDFAITAILIGIAEQRELRKLLAFKGGTALKKYILMIIDSVKIWILL